MLKRILMSLVLLAAVQAQTISTHPTSFLKTVQMDPAAIPSSLTCLVGVANTCKLVIPAADGVKNTDPYVCAVDFSATGQTITMQDGQSTPVVWFINGAALSSGFEWHATGDATCRKFTNGVYIQAGSSGATGSVIVKYGLTNF